MKTFTDIPGIGQRTAAKLTTLAGCGICPVAHFGFGNSSRHGGPRNVLPLLLRRGLVEFVPGCFRLVRLTEKAIDALPRAENLKG